MAELLKRLSYKDASGNWVISCNQFWNYIKLKLPAHLKGNAVDRLAQIEDILGETYDLDQLRELVEADKEGRLAILSEPMKPMVYKPNDTDVYCPKCGETLSGGWELSDADDGRKMVQCPKCGQAIDDTKCKPAAEAALAKEENRNV